MDEKNIVLAVRKAIKGVRVSKKKRFVFLKNAKSVELSQDTHELLKTLSLTYGYRVWTQLELFNG